MFIILFQTLDSGRVANFLGWTNSGPSSVDELKEIRVTLQVLSAHTVYLTIQEGEGIKPISEQWNGQFKDFQLMKAADAASHPSYAQTPPYQFDCGASSIESQETQADPPAHRPGPGPGRTLQCKRCGFLGPSRQCGEYFCAKTAWCEACCKTPAYISGDLLRTILNGRGDAESSARIMDVHYQRKEEVEGEEGGRGGGRGEGGMERRE